MGSISVINGTSNILIKNIPLSTYIFDLSVNPKTNLIYATSKKGVIIIDGKTNNILAGITFNINPSNAGYLICSDRKVLENYIRYEIGTSIECNAIPNTGFEFSS